MPSIEQRGDTYRITVSCGYSTTGKKLRRSTTWTPAPGLTAKQTERELQRQAVLFEEKVKTGQFLDGNIKLQDFAAIWMKDYSEKQHKAKNVCSNRDGLGRINAALGHIHLCKLQPHHILEFYAQMEEPGQNKRTGGALSPKTILNHHRILSSILSTAVQWGVIADNPAKRVKPPKVKRQEAKSLDDEQTMRLLAALEGEPIKYRAIVEVLLFSGARRGEALGLTWHDVNFDNCTLNIEKASLYLPEKGIYKDAPKNESSNRVVKVPRSVIDRLKSYRHNQVEQRMRSGHQWHDIGLVFTQWNGLPMHPDTVTRWFTRFIKRYNTTMDSRKDLTDAQKDALRLPLVSPHSLRHTNASLLIASGANLRTVANRLGHAQISTTANIYSHAIKTADAIASDALEAVLLGRNV